MTADLTPPESLTRQVARIIADHVYRRPPKKLSEIELECADAIIAALSPEPLADDDLSELERVAKAALAVAPHKWDSNDGADVIAAHDGGAVFDIAHVNPFDEITHSAALQLAEFIAAAHPARILDLIARVRGAPAGVPAGWQLVPVEPTEAMLQDSGAVEGFDHEYPNPDACHIAWWKAMIAASPPPPVGEDVVERMVKAHWDALASFKMREQSLEEMRLAAMRAALSAARG